MFCVWLSFWSWFLLSNYIQELWEEHRNMLEKYFGNYLSFTIWMGKHENELPYPLEINDIIELRCQHGLFKS